MINLAELNRYILTIKSSSDIDTLIEQWIETNCYFNLLTHSVDDFTRKINRNLQIAKNTNDTDYVKYISKKLKIEINHTKWDYTPNKIKIRVKTIKPTEGYKIDTQLSLFLGVPNETVFHYKSEIVKIIHKYIYDHELQNRYDRNTITPDEQLMTILMPLGNGDREYTYYNLPQYITGIDHLHRSAPVATI
jgi:chromatin remodeling complex protein RSC6